MHILGFHISYDLIPGGNQFPQRSGELASAGSAQAVILRGTHLLRHQSEARTEHCANDADEVRRTASSGPQTCATWPPVGSGAGVASGPAEETGALNRFRRNPSHAAGVAKLECQELRLRVPFLSGRARRASAGFRTPEDVGAQPPLGLMTAGRFQRSDGEGIVET